MKSNSSLYKLRYYVNKKILRIIFVAIFHSDLTYATAVWGQARIPQKRISSSEKKEFC